MNTNRRDFVRMLGATAASGALLLNSLADAGVANASSENARYFGGADLSNWDVKLGDAQWAADGESWPFNADIATAHNGVESELQANTQMRGIMTHNVTFNRWEDLEAFDFVHVNSYEFRMPHIPTTNGSTPNFNSQTLEGGFFIWDGADTRLDYGLAFQWILNPWMGSFGKIRMWQGDAGWVDVGYLEPDTNWHTVEFVYDHRNQSTALIIDGNSFLSKRSMTPKDPSWGTEIAVRLQAEIISIWPGQTQTAPMHQAIFRNWTSAWLPYFDNVS